MEHLNKKLSVPLIERMGYLYSVLGQFRDGDTRVTSTELGRLTGNSATTIRKDIHGIGYNGSIGTRYSVTDLRTAIGKRLSFTEEKRACIVGLGTLGSALLTHFSTTPETELRLVAGFDSKVNRLETIQTSIELFPAYRIEEVVATKRISLAVIAVPPAVAQGVVDRCCNGGVAGILNCSTAQVTAQREGVTIRSFDLISELRILSARA